MWTTPSDLLRFAGAINDGRSPAMLEGHPVEPRMGAGLFLTKGDSVTWWSHSGSVDGFECLLAGDRSTRFAIAVMTNGPGGGSIATQVAARIGDEGGPAAVSVDHLTGEGILNAIMVTRFNLGSVGTFVLPSGLEVELSATAPDHWGSQQIQITLPGQPTVELAWPFARGHWRIPGLEAVVVYEPPDRLRLLHAGREVIGRRKK